jgi:hypothetical protein
MSTKKKAQDLVSIVAAISHDSTGFTPSVCERLQLICLEVQKAPATYATIRAHLSLTKNQLDPAIHAGVLRGIIDAPRRWSANRSKPTLVSLNLRGLRELRPSSASSPFESISRDERRLLARFDWCKAGIGSEDRARKLATLCALIRSSRQVSQVQLAGEMKRSEQTAWQAVADGKAAGVIRIDLNHKQGRGRKPSVLHVEWDVVRSNQIAPADRALDLGYLPQLFYERTPKTTRASRDQIRLLKSLDSRWRELGFGSLTQWLNARTLFLAIGDELVTSSARLADEFGASRDKIKTTARAARSAKVLTCKRLTGVGRKGPHSQYTPDWKRLIEIAGEPAKPAKRLSVGVVAKEAADSNTAPRADWRRTHGFKDFARTYLADNPGHEPAVVLAAFRREDPTAPFPKPHVARSTVGKVKTELAAKRT